MGTGNQIKVLCKICTYDWRYSLIFSKFFTYFLKIRVKMQQFRFSDTLASSECVF